MKKQASAPATSRSISDDLRSRYIASSGKRVLGTTPDCRALLSYATPAVGLGRHAQLPPGNFPKPSQAKCCFTADSGRAFKKRSIVPTTKEKDRHVMDNPDPR